jgi:hypothetical protein
MVAAATAFENEVERYVGSVVKTLSSPAIRCLRWFGKVRKTGPDEAVHEGVAARVFPDRPESEATLLVHLATQELIQKQLFYTHFDTLKSDEGRWAAGATKLGWIVIAKLWPKYLQS